MSPYLSSYWPDFEQTLKVGSWDPLEQIPIMTQFDQTVGPSLTDAHYHGDICPGNICLGDICPYQEHLGCY